MFPSFIHQIYYQHNFQGNSGITGAKDDIVKKIPNSELA